MIIEVHSQRVCVCIYSTAHDRAIRPCIHSSYPTGFYFIFSVRTAGLEWGRNALPDFLFCYSFPVQQTTGYRIK